MKRILKKMNIGVVLAIVLLLATTAYVIISGIVFNSRKDNIRDFLQQFVNDCCETNIGSADDMYDKQKDLISKYFSDYDLSENERGDMVTAGNYFDELDGRKENVTEFNGGRKTEPGEITACEAVIKNISVEKLGMNCAKVTVQVGFTATVKGVAFVYSLCGVPYSDFCDYNKEYTDPVFEISQSANMIYYLSPSGSSWKIDGIKCNNSSYSNTPKLVGGKAADIYPDEKEGGSYE